MTFKCFKIYVQRNIFRGFLPMFIQKVCTKICFICTFKRIFQWFLFMRMYKELKKLSRICTNFKMKICIKFFIWFFQKYVQNGFLWFFKNMYKMFFFIFSNIYGNDFFLLRKRFFNVENQVFLVRLNSLDADFFKNLTELKHMSTKIITNFLF